MWKCSVCDEQIEPNFDVCWNCGSFRDGSSAETFDPETEGVMDDATYAHDVEDRRDGSFVQLAKFWNAAEAHLVRSRLESEGIRAFVTDEMTSTTFSGMGSLAGSVAVQVAEKDFDRARQIYEEAQGDGDSDEEE